MARSDMTHMIMCIDSGRQADEVPEIVMRRLRLRKGAVGLGLHRMDDVRKLDRVLDEEDRDVVADEIPVAFLRVEFDGEAAHVARQVERAFRSGDGREAHEDRRFLAGALEDVGARIGGKRLVGLEKAVRAVAARVHDALRNALMVEVENLLAKVKVLDQRWTALADLQRVLIVGNRAALGRRQDRLALGDLVKFASVSTLELLVMDRRGLARRLSSGLGHRSTFVRELCACARLSQCGERRTVPER